MLQIERASFVNPWTREMYLAELENRGVSYCLVARDRSQQVVGFCSFWRVLDELHINNLAVLPAYRRAGIGSALLTHVLDEGARHELQAPARIHRRDPELLRHLVRNRGKNVSRKAILEEVWGLHEDTDTRAVDNFIVRLRRYIEDDPSKPKYLLTVRSVGYRFVG